MSQTARANAVRRLTLFWRLHDDDAQGIVKDVIEGMRADALGRLMALSVEHKDCSCPIGDMWEEDHIEILDAIFGPVTMP